MASCTSGATSSAEVMGAPGVKGTESKSNHIIEVSCEDGTTVSLRPARERA